MPKKGRGKSKTLDPLSIPVELQTALEALYGHYAKTFDLWQKSGIKVPPCFIVVCNNTSTSKLVYDYISGFQRENEDGSTTLENGRLALFRNFDEHGNPIARPRTLLIDSEQLESGDAWTTTSAPWPLTRSSGSGARSSNAPATAGRPRNSPIRTCCGR
jgi:type III restriction enzyme